MFNVILLEPEIPQNTGNIIRLCANTGCRLHLVRPLGFVWDDRRLKRAGLDYREWASVSLHDDLDSCLAMTGGQSGEQPRSLYALTSKGKQRPDQARFRPGDRLLFGPETRGLPADLLAQLAGEQCLRIPMQANSRSLNLANSVAVVVYEAWRQQDFAGVHPESAG